ncbi:hypothetical protein N7462_001328 [Penicillium macrosclerotiorum]|uniref:uncharacterized protein n=1 Tax=Penicillium macrosclerotiorum TaxID=303699 RepID=UPI002546C6B0|nr:uncharacterized protein N7462_001328 [Penicillium macrosclerotiorum]KAJ5691905.1 hypothetical protein N7462_001328 [Penicillium macrosclerotiorum]
MVRRTPEQQYQELVKRSNIPKDEVLTLFDQLKPAKLEQFIGPWKAASVSTGHPIEQMLNDMRWAGKNFRSIEDVDPVVIYKDDGSRRWNEDYGHARLRQVEFRGVVSTAMVYDDFPIIDYFRYVNDDLLAGAMDSKIHQGGTYYFYIYR